MPPTTRAAGDLELQITMTADSIDRLADAIVRQSELRTPTAAEPAAERRLFDLTGAARYLGDLSTRTVQLLQARGEISATYIGSRRLYDRQDLDDYVERRRAAR